MNDFQFYVNLGFKHVLDFNAYDHIIFLIVLAVVYSLRKFKLVLALVSLFTIGHCLTLGLAVFNFIKVDVTLVEFLIPVTILFTAMVNIYNPTSFLKSINSNLVFAFVFGLIHGVGFSNGFKSLVGKSQNKLLPLIEFAIGVELAQIVIVLGVLFISFFGSILIGKRLWVFLISMMVLVLSILMISDRWIF